MNILITIKVYSIHILTAGSMAEDKLLSLLGVVIDNYINKGEPVGSKFLHTLDTMEYAPSTLRKYLNLLEKE